MPVRLGFPWADLLVGFGIGIAILVVVVGAAREMWQRMTDATAPMLIEQVECTARSVANVLDVHDVTLRWLGHRQRGKLHITVNCQLPTVESHRIAEEVRHALFHTLLALVEMTVKRRPVILDCNWHRGRQVNDDDAKVAWVTTPASPLQFVFLDRVHRPCVGCPDEKRI